jgi:5-methylthioadenosine/S-adenosylhomocysteine deaminase
MTPAAPEACDHLIRHGYVLTVDPERTVHSDGAIAITGSIISAVGPDAEITARYSASRVINARGAPVHPGMIDPRVHTTTHLSRTARTIRQSTHSRCSPVGSMLSMMRTGTRTRSLSAPS